jgi:4-hydroxy-3-methylbut-2-enyl diphosphate reductase
MLPRSGILEVTVTQTYFQKGFGLKAEVGPVLARSYKSPIVETLKQLGYDASARGLRVKLAREFGFCYGVDRAVEYAYETRHRFPDRRIYLSGEIIHNPDVNTRLQNMGICLLPDSRDPGVRYAPVQPEDVVILPAFGVTAGEMAFLSSKGCVLVDTTCGSVLNVWKKVNRCARDGYTVIIHGKHYHEETRATASQALTHPGSHYVCVRDVAETAIVCGFITGSVSAGELLARFAEATSTGFDPAPHLQRIGVANQTTMLMSETLQVQELLREAMRARYGEAALAERFRAFDTICSATQDRQDAVLALLDEGGLDLMIVIGGYNSSNTQALARMSAARLPTFHIESAASLGADAIRHRPVGAAAVETISRGWLPAGAISVGVTAGASTPDSAIGDVLESLLALRGAIAADLAAS